jgi:hypothetical protein
MSTYGDAPLNSHVDVRLDQLMARDFAPPIDPRQLTLVGWTVLSESQPVPFDYCVANFAVIKR